jgi:hypothetical protein
MNERVAVADTERLRGRVEDGYLTGPNGGYRDFVIDSAE